jgi:hypothetical protein
MIDPRKIGQFLLGEWDKTKQPLKERASVLPLGQYEDGSVGLAWPGLLAAPAEGVKNFGTYGYGEDAVPYNSRMAFDAAGGAMTGGLGIGMAGGMVDNALGSAGGKLSQAPQGIRAYHGSPHDFDRFSLDAIGTGEGAQAYGHGLYFADSEDVARNYREALADGYKIDGQPFNASTTKGGSADVGNYAADALSRFKGDRATAIQWLREGGSPSETSAADMLEKAQSVEPWNGRMYEVNIKANPEDFLDWDKPLRDQNEKIRNAIAPIADERSRYDFESLSRLNPIGGEVYRELANVFSSPDHQAAVAALREAGIPGIKYLDGMSRDGGAGTSNYVVFDDQLIDILRKYANAPTGAAIPLGMEGQEQDPALVEYLKAIGLY